MFDEKYSILFAKMRFVVNVHQKPIFRRRDIFKGTQGQNTEGSTGQGTNHLRILRVKCSKYVKRLQASATIKGQEIQEFLTLDDVADKLSRNGSKELSLYGT